MVVVFWEIRMLDNLMPVQWLSCPITENNSCIFTSLYELAVRNVY